MKDVQIKPGVEGFALDMGLNRHFAVMMDVQTELRGEDGALGTGLIATHKMNLLHLDQNTMRLLQTAAQSLSNQRVSLKMPSEDKK
jgi:hypothetical protein